MHELLRTTHYVKLRFVYPYFLSAGQRFKTISPGWQKQRYYRHAGIEILWAQNPCLTKAI